VVISITICLISIFVKSDFRRTGTRPARTSPVRIKLTSAATNPIGRRHHGYPHRLLQASCSCSRTRTRRHGPRAPWSGRYPEARAGPDLRARRGAPGVFVAIAEGVPYYVANSVVVVGEDAVLLVDSSAGTNEARACARPSAGHGSAGPVRRRHALPLRPRPRPRGLPEALTIGHDATRAGLVLGARQPTLARNLTGMTGRIAGPRGRGRTEKDGGPQGPTPRPGDGARNYRRQLAALTPSQPTSPSARASRCGSATARCASCTWTRAHGGRHGGVPPEGAPRLHR